MKKDENQLDLFQQMENNLGSGAPIIPNMLDLLGGGLNIPNNEPVIENRYEKIKDMLSLFDTHVSSTIDNYLRCGRLSRSDFDDLRSVLMEYMESDDECVKFLEAYLEDIRREASTVFKSSKNSLAVNMLVDIIMTRVDALIPKYRAYVKRLGTKKR